jgi:hypothetical protein
LSFADTVAPGVERFAIVFLQVCLAAETCGHVEFNTRGDVWYSSEPFHCGDIPPGHVTYLQIFQKVGAVCLREAAGWPAVVKAAMPAGHTCAGSARLAASHLFIK